jgi:signal peptide peptidase SppA
MYLMNEVSSSGTSAEALQQTFHAMVESPEIGAIVLDIDSPGGSSAGIAELADEIFAAREKKTIVAVANSLAASAAYWLGSQAHEFVVTPSGFVGSIGVFTYHDDFSGHLEQMGIKRTWIHAGRYKVEGNPTEPLGDDARTYEQQIVDAVYDAFTAAVARGRRVSKSAARGEAFGEGRILTAGAALEAGLVDRIETLQQTLDRLASRHAAAAKSKASAERDRRRVRLAELGA